MEQQISLLRGHRVMLSTNLARLYEVEPRALVQAVKRNIARFPEDFMYQLNQEEFQALKSQIVISSCGGMRRANPYASTEQGVAMLSSVLRRRRAIQVNIEIMRAFVRLRRILALTSLASWTPSRRNTVSGSNMTTSESKRVSEQIQLLRSQSAKSDAERLLLNLSYDSHCLGNELGTRTAIA
jgi:hypothetical protein